MTLPFSDPVLIFASVMLLILSAPMLAKLLRLPEIVGLIIAGMIVGPHGVGLLERDQTIVLLGNVGLLFIMFIAGLDIDLNQVRRKKSHTLVFGLLTFAIPMAMGTTLGMAGFGMTAMVSVLLASMFSSHTLLTYPLIGKLGLAKTRSVTTTIGGTIITDTMAFLVLAVIATAARGETLDTMFWIKQTGLIIVYGATVVTLLPIAGRWFFREVDVDEDVDFVFVVAATFLCAWLAHLAGLEPIIGAFLAGLTFNTLIPEKSQLMSRIHFAGNAIFIPFFLLSVGMLVDLSLLLTGADAWIISSGMIVIALVSKYFAAQVFRFLLRYNRHEAHLIYGLSVNQAAATLAAVLIGYNIGLFDEVVITGTIMMIAATCVVGSFVTQSAGKRVALLAKQTEFDAASAANRILIPLKQRADSDELLDIAFLLREKHSTEPLFPLNVVQDIHNSDPQVAEAEKILAHYVVRATDAGVPVIPVTRVDINIVSGVLGAMKDYRISIALFNWDGKQSSRARTFGRYLDAIIYRSHQMILVNRITAPINTAQRILFILPPLAEREIGFNDLAKTIKILANQAGTSLIILCNETTHQSIRKFVKSIRPHVPLSFNVYSSYRKVTAHLCSMNKKYDWLIMMYARKGDIAWQPVMNLLPGMFTRTFPDHPVSVIISPTEHPQDSETPEEQPGVFSVFKPENIHLHIRVKSTGEAISRLVDSCPQISDSEKQTVIAVLEKNAMEQPVELFADAALLHTHVDGITESIALLGVSDRPLKIGDSNDEPHLLIILLGPEEQETTQHLQALAAVARVIMKPGTVTQLRAAHSINDLMDQINFSESVQE